MTTTTRRLALTVLAAAVALIVASCAFAGSDRGGEVLRTTLPSIVPTGSGSSIAGIRVDATDGYIRSSAPITELADTPAIRNLEPGLRSALEQATAAARAQGVVLNVNSAWRSKHYQRALLDEGVQKYGSMEEARRWVNTPEKSSHVTGHAVDVGPTDAMSWMSQHGADYGLCQTYGNENWHFQLATTPGGVCPEMLIDGSAG